MTTWRRFRSLSAADRSLVVESAALLTIAAAGLSLVSFVRIRRLLHTYSNLGLTHARSDAARVAWAVTAAARYVPLRTSCLIESLAAEALLRRRGNNCTLRLGVIRHEWPDGLDAHAWIECDGEVIIGAVDRLEDYAVIAELPAARIS